MGRDSRPGEDGHADAQGQPEGARSPAPRLPGASRIRPRLLRRGTRLLSVCVHARARAVVGGGR